TTADFYDECQSRLKAAVELRMESDVPLGCFLSGGIDSSLIAALMQSAHPNAIKTFTVGSPGTRYDESSFAESVARSIGSDHTTINLSEADLLAIVPRLSDIYSEPFADFSQIPTAALCAAARQHVTVSVAGDGGDEFFAGYPRFHDGVR